MLQREPSGDPLVLRYSKCTQQPLVKNAGAITPAQSESVNATKPSCCHLLRLLLNLSILHTNRRANRQAGRCSRHREIQLHYNNKSPSLPDRLSVSHEVQLLPLPPPSSARDSQTSVLKQLFFVCSALIFPSKIRPLFEFQLEFIAFSEQFEGLRYPIWRWTVKPKENTGCIHNLR